MAKQALRFRKPPLVIEAGVWLEDQLRPRPGNPRDGAAAYAAVPSSGQTTCGAESNLLRSRLARFRHGRAGDGSLRNWTWGAQNAGICHA